MSGEFLVACTGRDNYVPFLLHSLSFNFYLICRALATLNCIRPEVLDTLEEYMLHVFNGNEMSVKTISQKFNRQELGNIAWVCAVCNKFPEKLIETLHMGLMGVGEKSDPDYVNNIYKDGNMGPSVVMSLLYLQANMVLQNSNRRLVLPPNFPEGWLPTEHYTSDIQGSSNTIGHTLGEEDSFELSLTSSKIQLVIGEAFDRIGFDHVQELTIDAAAMDKDYGVFVTSVDTELLSLDLAQIETKIGIEVDGPGHFVTRIDNGPTKAAVAGHETGVIFRSGKYQCNFDWSYEDQEMNGSSVMKERMLELLGWNTVHIPFWEWYAIRGSPEKEEAYCRSKLADADIVP